MSNVNAQELKYCNVLGLKLHVTSYQNATDRIMDWVKSHNWGYVSVANVHMVMEAYDSPLLQQQINHSLLTVPDGMPLVWLMRKIINPGQTRVYGPTLMLHLCDEAEKMGVPIGLYGSSSSTIDKLKRNLLDRFPGLKIGYSFSPPFRPLTPSEDRLIIEGINSSDVGILFVALGCPKQEQWMAEHSASISSILVGVGAAFDFHAGTIRQSPAFLQSMGLEWMFRLLMEPRRLFKRYFKHNPRFIILSLLNYYRSFVS